VLDHPSGGEDGGLAVGTAGALTAYQPLPKRRPRRSFIRDRGRVQGDLDRGAVDGERDGRFSRLAGQGSLPVKCRNGPVVRTAGSRWLASFEVPKTGFLSTCAGRPRGE